MGPIGPRPDDSIYITSATEFDAIDWGKPNQNILLQRGLVLRKSIITAADNISIGSFGTGDLPALVGSTEITTSFTNVSGNVWSTSLASSPSNVFERTAFTLEGMTKLTQNTSTPTTPGAGEWGYSSATLYINSTTDPNSKHYERVTIGSTSLVDVRSNGCTVENIAALCSVKNGILFNLGVVGGTARGCDIFSPTNDGIDGESGGTPPVGILVERNRIRSAGYGAKNGGGASGDGISFHAGVAPFDVTVRYNDIRECWKSGIGNQSPGNCTAYFNYLQNNWDNIAVFGSAGGDGSAVAHKFWYNIAVHTAANSRGFSITGMSGVTSDVRVELHNNVLQGVKTATKGGVFVTDSSHQIFSIQNNIITGWVKGIDSVFSSPVFESLDYNDMYNNTINFYDNSTGNLQPSVGTHNITSNPLFTNAANSDFTLQSGSPCIGAGIDVGLSTDYAGNPVGNPPCIGAYERSA